MAKTYLDLMAEIQALQAKAEILKVKEKGEVIAKMKVAIAHYGLTAADLGYGTPNRPAKPKLTKMVSRKAGSKSSVRYSDGPGNSWTGMGPKPKWFKAALADGRTPESLMAGSPENDFPTKRKPGLPAKFKDDGGNTWSGRGSQPRWLREALAGGKTLDQLAV